MKKIINIICLSAVILLFSCSPQEKDIFDDSSANRIEAVLKSSQEILIDAKNGWLMEYYPSSQRAYGGYNLLVSFTDDKVTVAGEINDSDETTVSLYSLKQSAGPVLTFDTYNDTFHFFSTPDSDISGVGNDGVGLGGDFEFLILKATPDSVILKGKKTSNRIIMTPLAEDVRWTEYLDQIDEAADKMSFRKFEYQVNNNIVPVSVSYRTLSFTYTGEEGTEVTETVPYIQTATGYKLYEPFTLYGVTVKEFKYEQEGDAEFFVPADGGAAKLVVVFPPINEQLVTGDWYFKYSGIGLFGKAYWNYAKTNGLDVIGEQLYYAYMGTYSDGQYGFSFGATDGTYLYGGALIFEYQLQGENKVTYTFALAGAGNGVWYYSNAAFAYLIYPLHGGSSKTFTLTSDNMKNPTWIQLTDDENPDNTFVLEASPVIWPYAK